MADQKADQKVQALAQTIMAVAEPRHAELVSLLNELGVTIAAVDARLGTLESLVQPGVARTTRVGGAAAKTAKPTKVEIPDVAEADLGDTADATDSTEPSVAASSTPAKPSKAAAKPAVVDLSDAPVAVVDPSKKNLRIWFVDQFSEVSDAFGYRKKYETSAMAAINGNPELKQKYDKLKVTKAAPDAKLRFVGSYVWDSKEPGQVFLDTKTDKGPNGAIARDRARADKAESDAKDAAQGQFQKVSV